MKIERICPWCKNPVPEDAIGPFCSTEHKWFQARKNAEKTEVKRVQDSTPSTRIWSSSPRRVTGYG